MATDKPLTTRAYAVLSATRGYGLRDPVTGLLPVKKVRIVKVLANPPQVVEADQAVIEIRLQVDPSLFEPASGIVDLAVEPTHRIPTPVVAEAVDAEAAETEDPGDEER